MNEQIKVGDYVLVEFDQVNHGAQIEGVVLHIPQDTGDMWQLKSKYGVHAINPNCSALMQIYKKESADEAERG